MRSDNILWKLLSCALSLPAMRCSEETQSMVLGSSSPLSLFRRKYVTNCIRTQNCMSGSSELHGVVPRQLKAAVKRSYMPVLPWYTQQ